MSEPSPSPHAFRVRDLARKSEHGFDLRPSAEARSALAAALDLQALRKLTFAGTVRPVGDADWQLTGHLGGTVVQLCSVTLAPVTTRLEADVVRTFQASYREIDEAEAEMPEDETAEPLGRWIDPVAIMEEELALAVPHYPRADGAALGEMVITEPGQKPMRDEDAKPFAGLSDLKKALESGSGSKDDT